MKKMIGIAGMMVLMFAFTACGSGEKQTEISAEYSEEITAETGETEDSGDGKEAGPRTYQKDFGSYELPEGWVEAEKYSSENQFFYVREGQAEDERPDNIAVTTGKNRYEESEHEQFRDAIMTQIMQQIDGEEGIELTGNGSYTEKDYVVYTFTVTETDPAVVTTQYYIVGDYKYCLVHETNFTGDSDVDRVAKHISDSFVWKE